MNKHCDALLTLIVVLLNFTEVCLRLLLSSFAYSYYVCTSAAVATTSGPLGQLSTGTETTESPFQTTAGACSQ